MFKPGDKVKMNPECYNLAFYSNQNFTVVKINVDKNTVSVDKPLKMPVWPEKEIHISYIILDTKEMRKQKLNNICSNQEKK